MPIYEYQCTSCHHHFDLMQKFNEAPISLCPKCGESTVIKLISAAGFQLKGTGWYATDFKNKPGAIPETKAKETTTKESKESTAVSSSTESKTKTSPGEHK